MLQGPIPVEFGMFFPDGAYAAGPLEKLRDFDRSKGDRVVQQLDKAHGPAAVDGRRDRRRPAGAAADGEGEGGGRACPVLPTPPAGSPFTPVEFTGLMVTPYVNDAKRLAYSLKATGVRAPSRGHRPPGCEAKDAA